MPETSVIESPTASADTYAQFKTARAEQRKAAAPAADSTPKEPTSEPQGTTETKPEGVEPKTTQEPAKPERRDKSAEGRIAELTAAQKREKERADKAEARIRELEAAATQPKPEPPKAEPKPAAAAPNPSEPIPETGDDDPEPTFKAFAEKYAKDHPEATHADTYDAFWKETRAWEKRQAKRDSDKAAIETANRSAREKLNAALTEVRTKHADFDSVTAANMQAGTGLILSPTMQQFLLENPAEGLEVAYYLGSNPEEYKRVFAISPGPGQGSPFRQIAELGKIAAKLATPEKPKPQPTPISRAAPPARTVSGTSGAEIQTTAEARNYDEFKRVRKRA